jgi:hypothetical protein
MVFIIGFTTLYTINNNNNSNNNNINNNMVFRHVVFGPCGVWAMWCLGHMVFGHRQDFLKDLLEMTAVERADLIAPWLVLVGFDDVLFPMVGR